MFNKCLTRALKFACQLARVPFVWQNNKSYTTPTLITGSRGDVFVVRTSKPVENLWKNGLFWSRDGFVTHSIDRKPRDWGLARSAYGIKYVSFRLPSPSAAVHIERSHVVQVSSLVLSFTRHFVPRATAFGHPSGEVPCASEDMACGYWFSKVDLGQIRSEEIVYSRFIKIPLG